MVPALLVPTGTPPELSRVPRPHRRCPTPLSLPSLFPRLEARVQRARRRDDIPFETKLQAINRLQEGLTSRTARDTPAILPRHGGRFRATMAPDPPPRRRRRGLLVAERGLDRDAADARALEEEFWRVVETNVEEVKVEYGSDLDADVYGSGFARAFNPRAADEDEARRGRGRGGDPTRVGFRRDDHAPVQLASHGGREDPRPDAPLAVPA